MTTLAALWITWCTLHSLLISRGAHNLAKLVLGDRLPVYRLCYVGFSVITLVPVLWYQFSLQQKTLLETTWPVLGVQALLLVYSLSMFYAGARVYDMSYFLGLRQLRSLERKKKIAPLPFHTDGILTYVRHPWYSGGIAFLWGAGAITDVYLVSRSLLTAYILIGTLLEESRLKKELGEQYREYCRMVPMLLPWRRRKREA